MQQANPITCGSCGAENPPDAEYCENCGKPLTRSAQEGSAEQGETQVGGGILGIGEGDADVDAPGLEEGPRRRGTRTGVADTSGECPGTIAPPDQCAETSRGRPASQALME
ncbi:MAG TPA: zinc-ribbon domain-containing protein [Thermomicrobiales bacterium]|nr:zinc-ribbon domain-containing protein [Thermomicrobiales bacterium]